MFSKVVVFLAAVAFVNAGYLAPALHHAPAISIAAPAISRVEHLPPVVASSYKTDVITPPVARTYEIQPAITHVAQAPVVPVVHHAPTVLAAPAISRIEHLPPVVASSYKTDIITPPIAKTFEIQPAITHVAPAPVVHVAPAPLIARAPLFHSAPLIAHSTSLGHFAPAPAFAAHGASFLRAAPAHLNFGFDGHLAHGYGLGHAKFF